MTRVFYTHQADRDLLDLWLYIAQDNPAAADRQLEAIHASCERLAEYPGIGQGSPDIRPGMKRWPVGSYLVLHRLISDGIEVVRVVHGARHLDILDLE